MDAQLVDQEGELYIYIYIYIHIYIYTYIHSGLWSFKNMPIYGQFNPVN